MNPQFDVVVAGECPRDLLLDFNPAIERFGGASYSAMVARALGAQVGILGDTGDDKFGDGLSSLLLEWGIDSRGIERLAGPTPTYQIRNSNEIVPQLVTKAFGKFRPARSADIPPEYMDSQALLMYPYDLGLLQLLAAPVHEAGGTVYFDLQHDIRSLSEWSSILALTDVVFASHNEILHITESADLFEAAAVLRGLGPQLIVIKIGQGGSLAFSEHGPPVQIPSYLSNFRCTIGAGDAYNAAFAVARLKNDDILASGISASIVASLFVEQLTSEDIYDTISGAKLDQEKARRQSVFLQPR